MPATFSSRAMLAQAQVSAADPREAQGALPESEMINAHKKTDDRKLDITCCDIEIESLGINFLDSVCIILLI